MDNVYVLGPDGELYHHGIKGMKWGFRRYQNPDGSLTTAGRKRYNDELERVKKETSEVKAQQRAQKRTIAKAEKVAQAKKELDELKKSGKQLTKETKAAVAGKKVPVAKDSKDNKPEKPKEPEKPVETDADKKARLLREPNAKEILENRRLFSDGELNSLKLRMGTERDISSFIPAEISKGEQFVNKFVKTADTVTKVVDSGSKAWNGIAKISNSLFGTEFPMITEKARTEAEKIKEKAELLKAKNELAKAQKENPNRPKTEEEEYAAKTREINAQLARQKAVNGLNEELDKQKDREAALVKAKEDVTKAKKSGDSDDVKVAKKDAKKAEEDVKQAKEDVKQAEKTAKKADEQVKEDVKPAEEKVKQVEKATRQANRVAEQTEKEYSSAASNRHKADDDRVDAKTESGTSSKKSTSSSDNNSSKKTTSPFGKNYEKRVDKILEQMDLTGWDIWNAEQTAKSSSSKVTVKTKAQKDYERRVDRALEKIDNDGWDLYYELYGKG